MPQGLYFDEGNASPQHDSATSHRKLRLLFGTVHKNLNSPGATVDLDLFDPHFNALMIKLPRLRRPLSLSTCLALIVLVAILPVLFFSEYLADRLIQSKYEANARLLSRTADQLSFAVDQEIIATIRTLQALSQSNSLQSGDLKNFHQFMRRTLRTQPSWSTVILQSPTKEWLLTARQPYGTKLGTPVDPESISKAVETGEPQIGKIGSILEMNEEAAYGFAVRVPVKSQNGKVTGVLSAILSTSPMQEIASHFTSAPGEWVRSIVNSQGTIAARTREPDKYIGSSASEMMKRLLFSKGSGLERTTTLDQIPVYTAFSKAPISGWYTIVSVRADILESEARKAQNHLWIVSILIVCFSGFATWIFSRWMKKAIKSSSQGAATLARGETPVLEPSVITELEDLRHSLVTASALLQSRDRAKSEFLANMSHEIRTPLGIVLGMTDLIIAKELTEEEHENMSVIVKRNGQQLLRLINDILDLAKIESSSMILEAVDFSLPQLLSFVAEDFSSQAQEKGIKLQVVIEDGSPQRVKSDPYRLRQIIFNLVTNAMKFTDEGVVEVRLYASKGKVARLTVSDTGIGISEELQAQLFSNFSQGDSSHSRRYGGTGLGLALSRKLARLLKGDLKLLKTQVNQGSVFELVFQTQFSDEQFAVNLEPNA